MEQCYNSAFNSRNVNNNVPYFIPLSAKKREREREQFTNSSGSWKLRLINTQGFCKWKKQLGHWAYYPILLEHLVYIFILSVSLQRVCNERRNTSREKNQNYKPNQHKPIIKALAAWISHTIPPLDPATATFLNLALDQDGKAGWKEPIL